MRCDPFLRWQRKAIVSWLGVMVGCGLWAACPTASGAARAARERRVVYLVPDLPTFLYYLGEWEGENRFPIFMKRDRYFEKFVRAYKPEAIYRAKRRELKRVDADMVRGAVCAAWGKERLSDFGRGLSRDRFKERLRRYVMKPEGIVLSDLDAKQLPAALALAAAHGQALDFLSVSSSVGRMKLTDAMSFEEKEAIRKDVIRIIERWGYSYRNLGDDIDFITLGLDLPIAYRGTAPETKGKQRLCLDDGINRLTPDGSLPRSPKEKKSEKKQGYCYAYAGRLLEAEEGMALYQAMCSIFLETDKALYFDRWPENWGLRALEGWWVLQTKVHATLVRKSESSLARWRKLVGDLNPYGFVHVSSSGNSRGWGDGRVSDIPESEPAVVFFAHSFSAANPYDMTTIAGRWLQAGAYVYYGAMSEPFAQSFNVPRTAAAEAIAGQALGRAFQAKRLLPERFAFPWKQIYIGDPLHRMRFAEDASEPEDSRRFREAVGMIRDLKLGPAIEILESILESAEEAIEKELVWSVLDKTFRVRYFAVRTRRMPVERYLDTFFMDCWYNDTHHPNGQPMTAVVLNNRLNLFSRELVKVYEGLGRTIEGKPNLKKFLGRRVEEMKADAVFVKVWMAAGPLTEAEDGSEENPFDPEKRLRLGATWQVEAGEIGWQPAMVGLKSNSLDLGAIYGKGKSVVYAGCFPVLAREGTAAVRLGVSGTGRVDVWLNNEFVASAVKGEEEDADERMVDLELKSGENFLFFKVFGESSGCELAVKITDRSGNYVEELDYADPLAKLSAAGVKIDLERWKP